MHVSDITVRGEGDLCELSASVKFDTHWVWGDEPFRLWYRFPTEYVGFLREDNADPFVAAMLPLAMVLGESLAIDATVSRKLRSAVPEIQTIYRCWNDELHRVSVLADERTERARAQTPKQHTGLFFSLGVDSSYSLWKNTKSNVPEDRRVSHLVVVEGFDIYLWERERFPPLLDRMRRVGSEFGKTVLPVTTNLRDVSDRVVDWVRYYHGPALATVPLALGRMFRTSLIAASQTYRCLIPRGAHPLLDPLWSTEWCEFQHDGLEATRMDKIRSLAECPQLIENLRVCTTDELTDSYNCGRCEKCLRTMIGLHIAGVLEVCRTLPSHIDLAMVRGLVPNNRVALESLRELALNLGGSPLDRDLRSALEECIARSQEDPRTAH